MTNQPVSRSTSSRWCVLCAVLATLLSTAGCTGLEKLRGDGLRDSENWGQHLRDKQRNGLSYGGVSTEAHQIERNLGVE